MSDPSGEEDLREREEAAGWRSLSGPAGPRLREELQHVHLPRPLAVRSARPAPSRRVRSSMNDAVSDLTPQIKHHQFTSTADDVAQISLHFLVGWCLCPATTKCNMFTPPILQFMRLMFGFNVCAPPDT